MNLKMEVNDSYCSLYLFKINGIKADYRDFGDKSDNSADCAEDYGCGDMRFNPKPASQEILDKYKITIEEYNEICDKLDCLSFGNCGLCT